MMGNLELEISDFQSIGKAKFDFVKGINLIVGQSNSGKTASLRAVKSVVTNPTSAKKFVKHRANEANVGMTYLDNEVIWTKSAKGGTTYFVNGEEYSKMGTQDLFNLLPDNGFVRDGNGNVMNIEGEWDIPFPFDKSPAELFRLFENVFCVSDSTTILKAYKEEEADLVKQNSDLQDKVAKLEKKEFYLTELEKEVNIEEVEDKLKKFRTDADEYLSLGSEISAIMKSAKFSDFVLDEVTAPTENSLDKYTDVIKDLSYLEEVAEKIKFYKTLPEVMDIPNSINNYLTMWEDMQAINLAHKADNFIIDREIEVTGDNLTSYFNLLEDLEIIDNGFKASSIQLKEDCTYSNSLTIAEYETMKSDLEVIVSCFRKCKAAKTRCEEIDEQIKAIEAKLSEYKVCPLCGHELGDEHKC